MAATAFKGILTYQNKNGIRSIPFTASDVNDAYYVFPSGASDLQFNAQDGQTVIRDVTLSAAGVDTSKAQVFVNDTTTGVELLNSANLTTTIGRQFQGAPMVLKAGSRLRIQQKT
jgi:hypothetical protein